MKKLLSILILSIFLLTLVNAFTLFPKETEFSYKIYPVEKEVERHIDYIVDMNKVEEVQEIMDKNINGKTYILHKYDCTDFSRDLIRSLKQAGYKAQCTAGNLWTADYTNHTWTSVWIDERRFEIESTNGEFITPKQYESYEVNWENKCW